MYAAARAIVVHLTPRRIRIKIPGWERRDADLLALRGKLETCPGIIHVRVNGLAASIVVHCRIGFQIASARHCFIGLDLIVPAAGTDAVEPMWQIGPPGLGRQRSACRLGAMAVDLAIAVWAHRVENLVIEWIFQGVVQVLLRRLYRILPPQQCVQARHRPLLVAAAA